MMDKEGEQNIKNFDSRQTKAAYVKKQQYAPKHTAVKF
jgi:hypothetical protein